MTRKRSTRFVYPLLAIVLSCFAATAHGKQEPTTPKPQRLDFEDDQVTGDLVRPNGDAVGGALHGKRASLIQVRASFLAELVASTDDL